MPAQRIGPLYGPLPEINEAWELKAEDGTVLYSPDDMLELIMEMQEIRTAYDQMSKMSIAMNSTADLSTRTVKSIQQDVIKWDTLNDQYNAKVEEIPVAVVGDLPIIKADVVEYSEEPLKNPGSYMSSQLQQLRERISRLQLDVCRRLDLCSFGLGEAICCSGPSGMGNNLGGVPLYRS